MITRAALMWVVAPAVACAMGCATSGRVTPREALPPPPGGNEEPASATQDEDELPEFGVHVPVEKLPEAILKVEPILPEDARLAGVEGTVVVQALVGRDGRVKRTRVTTSTPMLDDAAVEAVRQWMFRPAETAGRPVAVWVACPVLFRLP